MASVNAKMEINRWQSVKSGTNVTEKNQRHQYLHRIARSDSRFIGCEKFIECGQHVQTPSNRGSSKIWPNIEHKVDSSIAEETFSEESNGEIIDDKYLIIVIGTKIQPLLRCFGAKISKLELAGTNSRIDQYINRYCANTLVTIRYNDVQKNAFLKKNFSKPFKALQTIQLDGDVPNLGKKFTHFAEWFPNLRRLEISTSCIDEDFVAVTIPHLEELCIYGRNMTNHPYIGEKIANLLHANPNVRAICFTGCNFEFSQMLDTIIKNKMLESLSFLQLYRDREGDRIEAADVLRFAVEHPLITTLKISKNLLSVDVACDFIYHVKHLKSFKFYLEHLSEYNRFLTQLQLYAPRFVDWNTDRFLHGHIFVDLLDKDVENNKS